MKYDFRIDIVYNRKYECVVNNRFVIIEVTPYTLDFHLKDLKKVFNKYKTKAEFHFIGYAEPKPFLPEDIFEIFMYLNPSMKILVEQFEGEI